MATYFIGADVHSKKTQLAFELKGEIVRRLEVDTTIPAIVEALDSVRGRKLLTFEEGPMADWLYRNLVGVVDELVVNDPRRNRLISDDGDKDDPIDAAKQAELLRGGFLRSVYHSGNAARIELKQWVSLYHDRVHQAVREVNKIRARGRMYGVRIPGRVLRRPKLRANWLKVLANEALAEQMRVLWQGYDAAASAGRQCRAAMQRRAKAYPIIAAWDQRAGFGPVRAITMFAYLDNPWRFHSNKALAKYCGVGLVRSTSGTDKRGKPNIGQVRLAWACNRRLKDALVGGTLSAIRQGNNADAEYYRQLIDSGLTAANARHAVSRRQINQMWGQWKAMCRDEKNDQPVAADGEGSAAGQASGGSPAATGRASSQTVPAEVKDPARQHAVGRRGGRSVAPSGPSRAVAVSASASGPSRSAAAQPAPEPPGRRRRGTRGPKPAPLNGDPNRQEPRLVAPASVLGLPTPPAAERKTRRRFARSGG